MQRSQQRKYRDPFQMLVHTKSKCRWNNFYNNCPVLFDIISLAANQDSWPVNTQMLLNRSDRHNSSLIVNTQWKKCQTVVLLTTLCFNSSTCDKVKFDCLAIFYYTLFQDVLSHVFNFSPKKLQPKAFYGYKPHGGEGMGAPKKNWRATCFLEPISY